MDCRFILGMMPKSLLTKEFLLEAVRVNGIVLEIVPKESIKMIKGLSASHHAVITWRYFYGRIY